MSFLYEVFGIPRNLDEVIHKIITYGIERADVYVRYNNELLTGNLDHISNHTLEYGVRFSKRMKWMAKRTYVLARNRDETSLLRIRDATHKYMQDAIMLSRDLSKKLYNEGLEITINNEPIERTEQKANFLAARIEEGRRELSIP